MSEVATETPAAPVETPVATMSKMDAVRECVRDGVLKPAEACAHIKTKHGLDLTGPQFSTYKGQIAKKAAGKSTAPRKSGRPKGSIPLARPASPIISTAAKTGLNGHGGAFECAKAIKALCAKHGPAVVRESVELVS